MIRPAQFLVLSFALSACTSGIDDDGESAQFFDSLVEGLEYSSSSKSGVTDVNGFFNYKPGQETTFKVGDITLGSLTPSNVVSPVEFLGDDAFLDDDDKVLNVARFLQTIDEDGLPQNGITISEETRVAAIGKTINFDQTSSAWENDTEVTNTINALTDNPLVSGEDARAHILAWVAASKAGEYGGNFTQDLQGAVTGVPYQSQWLMSVSTAGEVIFIARFQDMFSNEIIPSSGSGTIDGSDGSFSVTTYFAQFQGTVIGTYVSGTWTGIDEYAVLSGSFAGFLTFQPMTFLDLDLVENYGDLDGETIAGEIYNDEEELKGDFVMSIYKDSHGRYDVSMEVDLLDDLHTASFYLIGMSSTRITFCGLCTSGEEYFGELSTTREVSGTYYSLFDGGVVGGTFSGPPPE